MKAHLEFTLPEEREEFDIAVRAADLMCILRNFDTWLGGLVNFPVEGGIDPELAREVRKKLDEMAEDYNVRIWK